LPTSLGYSKQEESSLAILILTLNLNLTLTPSPHSIRLLHRSVSGETEFRELTAEEMAHLRMAASPAGGVRVADLDEGVLRSLQRKGLVYDEVGCGFLRHLAAKE